MSDFKALPEKKKKVMPSCSNKIWTPHYMGENLNDGISPG